ncbi:MAG: hypothetical protein K0S29_604 [Gammaproteobacteria bacterium]|jgi:colicin import membrane protein|nr:hypothetical protein [Gammaproteobacteria bacterium]
MVLTIRALKKKLAAKDRSFWISLALHLLIILLLVVNIPKTPKVFQLNGPSKVNIVNATFVAPSDSTVPKAQPVPPPPSPAPVKPTPPQPKPAPVPVKPVPAPQPKPVSKPQPKPVPVSQPQTKTPVIQSKQADIAKPSSLPKKPKAQTVAKKQKTKNQIVEAQKALELKKQQAAAALKAMALSSIQSNIQAQQQQEAAAAAQQRLVSLKEQYMALIQQSIRANWINQFNPSQNLTATLHIELDQNGNVLSVSLLQSSGNPTFDRQAILAVRKSSPLPLPQDPSLIKDFMSLTLPFSNQGAS